MEYGQKDALIIELLRKLDRIVEDVLHHTNTIAMRDKIIRELQSDLDAQIVLTEKYRNQLAIEGLLDDRG